MRIIPSNHSPMEKLLDFTNGLMHSGNRAKVVLAHVINFVAASVFALLSCVYNLIGLLKLPVAIVKLAIGWIPVGKTDDGKPKYLGAYFSADFDILEVGKHFYKIFAFAIDIVISPLVGVVSPSISFRFHCAVRLVRSTEERKHEDNIARPKAKKTSHNSLKRNQAIVGGFPSGSRLGSLKLPNSSDPAPDLSIPAPPALDETSVLFHIANRSEKIVRPAGTDLTTQLKAGIQLKPKEKQAPLKHKRNQTLTTSLLVSDQFKARGQTGKEEEVEADYESGSDTDEAEVNLNVPPVEAVEGVKPQKVPAPVKEDKKKPEIAPVAPSAVNPVVDYGIDENGVPLPPPFEEPVPRETEKPVDKPADVAAAAVPASPRLTMQEELAARLKIKPPSRPSSPVRMTPVSSTASPLTSFKLDPNMVPKSKDEGDGWD
jgi:hypothetical protein